MDLQFKKTGPICVQGSRNRMGESEPSHEQSPSKGATCPKGTYGEAKLKEVEGFQSERAATVFKKA